MAIFHSYDITILDLMALQATQRRLARPSPPSPPGVASARAASWGVPALPASIVTEDLSRIPRDLTVGLQWQRGNLSMVNEGIFEVLLMISVRFHVWLNSTKFIGVDHHNAAYVPSVNWQQARSMPILLYPAWTWLRGVKIQSIDSIAINFLVRWPAAPAAEFCSVKS